MFKKEQLVKNYILFSLLFLFSACETGTKFEENSTKVKEDSNSKQESSIRALIERPSSAEELITKSYIDKNKEPIKPSKSHTYDPENPLNGESIVEDTFIDTEDIVEESIAKVVTEVETATSTAISPNDISFSGGKVLDGLNVKSIRVGRHETYIRLVFDIDQWLDVNKHGNSVKKAGHYMVTYSPNKNRIIVTMEGYRGFSAKFPKFARKDVIEKIYFNEYLDDSGFQFTIELKDSVKIRAYDYENPARLIIDVTPLV
jgi:hypothetical protein